MVCFIGKNGEMNSSIVNLYCSLLRFTLRYGASIRSVIRGVPMAFRHPSAPQIMQVPIRSAEEVLARLQGAQVGSSLKRTCVARCATAWHSGHFAHGVISDEGNL